MIKIRGILLPAFHSWKNKLYRSYSYIIYRINSYLKLRIKPDQLDPKWAKKRCHKWSVDQWTWGYYHLNLSTKQNLLLHTAKPQNLCRHLNLMFHLLFANTLHPFPTWTRCRKCPTIAIGKLVTTRYNTSPDGALTRTVLPTRLARAEWFTPIPIICSSCRLQ